MIKPIKMKSVVDHLIPENAKQIIESINRSTRLLKQQKIKTFTSQLNIIDEFEFILDEKRTVYSGDIIYRPLENFKVGQHMEMYHFGIVFGFSKDSKKLVLDISSGTDISIKTLQKFIKPYKIADVQIKRKPKSIKFKDIIARADSLMFEPYSIENLNCEQFANYCVFEKFESKGLQNAAKAASLILDIITSYIDLKLAYTPKEIQTDSVKKFNEKLKAVSNDTKKLK